MKQHRATGLILVVAACALAFVAPPAPGQKNAQQETLLQRAIQMETVDGNLAGAIKTYKEIVANAGANRAVAARALIRMGQCYEKLGEAQAGEARKAYERVVREFADQKEAVEQARALLSASTRDRPPESGLAFQRMGVLPPAPAGRWLSLHPSPDGRYMYFQIDDCMWQHDLATGENRKLSQGPPNPDPLVRLDVSMGTPEVSPDGKQIAYTRAMVKGYEQIYELWVVGIDGSGARLVMSDKERRLLAPKGWFSPTGWSPDARHILIVVYSQTAAERTRQQTKAPVSRSLALVSVTDGSVRAVGAQGDFSYGSFSPDGKYLVAYSNLSREGQGAQAPGRIKLIPVDGSSEIPVFESSATVAVPLWTPDGRRILFKSNRSGTMDLWALRMNGARPEGEPELVKREVGPMGLLGFTRDGSLYYYTSIFRSDVFSADLDPATGRVTSTPAQVNQHFVGSVGYPVEWSPDGQFLAYARIASPGTRVTGLVVRSERTREEREVVLAPAFSARTIYRAQWFPDGRSLLVSDYATGRVLRQIGLQTGQVRTFLDLSGSLLNDNSHLERHLFAPALSRDGKALYYLQVSPKFDSMSLMRRSTESGEERELRRSKGRLAMVSVSPSPDGRHLAFVQATLDRTENLKNASLMIMPADGGEPRELLQTTIPYFEVKWVGNRHLLMVREGSKSDPPELWSVSIDGGEPQPSGLAVPGLHEMAVHPDGNRIAFCRTTGPAQEVWAIRNLQSTPAAPRK